MENLFQSEWIILAAIRRWHWRWHRRHRQTLLSNAKNKFNLELFERDMSVRLIRKHFVDCLRDQSKVVCLLSGIR